MMTRVLVLVLVTVVMEDVLPVGRGQTVGGVLARRGGGADGAGWAVRGRGAEYIFSGTARAPESQ